jgi:prepilin-type N-terminal cleavage/methylation domain-containing protein
MVRRHVRPNAGFTLVEIMVVLSAVLVLMGVGFLAYSNLISQSKEAKVYSDLRDLGTATLVMYQNTGALAGKDQGVPFPDSLVTANAIDSTSAASVKNKWRGPYLKVAPVCPFNGCQYGVDYTKGQASKPGQTYLYFITASNVPLPSALTISKNANGDDKVSAGKCVSSEISNVVQGTETKPCEVYLSTNTGDATTKVTVYYVFMSGRL